MTKEIFVCDLCGKDFYNDDQKKALCAMSAHLQSHRLSKQYLIDNILNKVDNPKCACQLCELNVSLHKRKLKFNLFADECPNKGKFKNPSCLEFYVFNGYDIDIAINKIRKIQSKYVNQDRKIKLSNINSGSNNPSSFKSISKRTGLSINEVKNMLKQTSKKKENNPFYGKKHSQETLNRLAMIRSEIPKVVTRPELIMYGILIGMGIEFEYQVPIGKYTVDFMVGNFIIEVYGDYWHSKSMKSREDKFIKDIEKERFLKSNYDLLVIWESELINNSRGVVDEITKKITN